MIKGTSLISFAAYFIFLDTIGTFIEFLVCMYVIFVLSTVRFVITRLGMLLYSYFATTHAAVVGDFIVCKSTTSVRRIFL